MKIIFLVKNSHLMRYYVSRVHDRFPVSLIIQEQTSGPASPVKGLVQRILAKGASDIAHTIIRRFETDPQEANYATKLLANTALDGDRNQQE